MSDPNALLTQLRSRASACELCDADVDLDVHSVDSDPSGTHTGAAAALLACGKCRAQLAADAVLEPTHWYCLQTAIWSEVPVVQVVSWRMLRRLAAETWAADVLEQAYLDAALLTWAKHGAAGGDAAGSGRRPTLDSNGTELFDGDSVTLIKDLDVKGTTFVAKRGTMVRGIRLTDDPENIEGRVNKVQLVLKTCFLKRAT